MFGAQIPRDAALTAASAQLFFTPNWSALVKVDGEFASNSRVYAGTAIAISLVWVNIGSFVRRIGDPAVSGTDCLYEHKTSPAKYKAGLDRPTGLERLITIASNVHLAIARGWLMRHQSETYVRFTRPAPFA